ADGAVEAYRSDLFVARAQHRGVGVVVFDVGGHADTADWARQRELPYLQLPTDAEVFGRLIDQAIRRERRSRLAGDRRAAARTERAIDGTLVFHDGAGRRWYVYDRRSGERRRANPEEGESYRVFVSDDGGVELRCPLAPAEFQEARERYRLLAEHASDMIATLAPDGTFLYAAPALEALLGVPTAELLGRSPREFALPEDASLLLEAQQRSSGISSAALVTW